MKGILGRKIGMTQVFDQNGKLTPVTVVEVTPNVVTQIKTKANAGHTAKAKTTPKRFFKEIRGVNVDDYTLGMEVKADIFTRGEVVDVTGTSKGKGFQGVIKRHGQHRGPMGHGSMYHRRPGSMGACATPSRVFKGKKLPGHMGVETVTIQNLKVVSVDTDKNVILVKGSVPGVKGAILKVKTSVKA